MDSCAQGPSEKCLNAWHYKPQLGGMQQRGAPWAEERPGNHSRGIPMRSQFLLFASSLAFPTRASLSCCWGNAYVELSAGDRALPVQNSMGLSQIQEHQQQHKDGFHCGPTSSSSLTLLQSPFHLPCFLCTGQGHQLFLVPRSALPSLGTQ